MKKGQRYRITSSTMAILFEADHRTTVTVPAGAVITIAGSSVTGDRLIDVLWKDQPYMMFVQDIRERSEAIADSP